MPLTTDAAFKWQLETLHSPAAPTRVVVHAVDALLVPLQRHVGRGVAQAPHLQVWYRQQGSQTSVGLRMCGTAWEGWLPRDCCPGSAPAHQTTSTAWQLGLERQAGIGNGSQAPHRRQAGEERRSSHNARCLGAAAAVELGSTPLQLALHCLPWPWPTHLDGAVQRGGCKGVGVLRVEHQLWNGRQGSVRASGSHL